MAELGIKFTILAPHQAHRFRRIGDPEWIDVTGGRIDPTRAYTCTTPSGKKIALFFYDGPISRAVAFEGLLNNGEVFASGCCNAYSDGRDWAGAGAYRHRRRKLWASSSLWRDGAFLRAASHRRKRPRQADELWRVPREVPRPRTKQRSTRTRPGVAPTASAAGRKTAVATPAGTEGGIRSGALPCARR